MLEGVGPYDSRVTGPKCSCRMVDAGSWTDSTQLTEFVLSYRLVELFTMSYEMLF